MDLTSKKGWLQFSILPNKEGYLLWHMENSDPWYNHSCLTSYETNKDEVFTSGHESKVQYVLKELREDLLNAEGLSENDKDGLVLLLDKVGEPPNR